MAGGVTDPFDVRWLRLISFHNLEIWRPLISLTKLVASLVLKTEIPVMRRQSCIRGTQMIEVRQIAAPDPEVLFDRYR